MKPPVSLKCLFTMQFNELTIPVSRKVNFMEGDMPWVFLEPHNIDICNFIHIRRKKVRTMDRTLMKGVLQEVSHRRSLYLDSYSVDISFSVDISPHLRKTLGQS